MRIFLAIVITLMFPLAQAEVNIEKHDFQIEYGLAYHTLRGKQKGNDSTGRLSSPQFPFWLASYSLRFSQATALRVFGGVHFLRFEEPKFGTLIGEKQELVQYGAEITRKVGPVLKISVFGMKQDHPLYFAKTPTDFEVVRASFAQAGMHFLLSQRRRIGLLWGLGVKGFALFPVKGGDVLTEAGGGGEAYARLGWVGPLGTIYHIKGQYHVASAPNAEASFTHEILSYSVNVQLTF